MPNHPIQPLEEDNHGVIRFKENKIVSWMLDQGREGKKFDLNTIAVTPFDREDREQLAQLIGYSHSGAGELGYMSDAVLETAWNKHELGMTEDQAHIEYLTSTLDNVRLKIREGVAELYGKHPDDLIEVEE